MFATPQSQSAKLIQRSVDALRCQLVDRETDVRFVDVTELPITVSKSDNDGQNEQRVLTELARLRSEGRPDFEVVLIGKDGGIKARSSDPSALEDFLALVDTMPMRRAEMRLRGGADSECE